MEATTTDQTGSRSDALAGKYLTFEMGRTVFGMAVLSVREIVGAQDITAIPNTPPYIRGVINLRGGVIPVVDLGQKLGMEITGSEERRSIIVVEIQTARGRFVAGAAVGAVSEVLNLPASAIEATPDFGSGVSVSCLLGMAKTKETIVLLLDVEQVVAGAANSDDFFAACQGMQGMAA